MLLTNTRIDLLYDRKLEGNIAWHKFTYDTWNAFKQEFSIEEKDIPSDMFAKESEYIYLNKKYTITLEHRIKNPILYWAKNNEYNARIIANLLVALSNGDVGDESFVHANRNNGVLLCAYIWDKKIPGRLEELYKCDESGEINPVRFLNAALLLKDKFYFDEDSKEYRVTLSINKDNKENKLLEYLKAIFSTEEHDLPKIIENDGYIAGTFKQWGDLVALLVTDKSLEKTLYDVQQQERLTKINSEEPSNKLSSESKQANLEKIISSLELFKKNILENKDFFRHFSGKKNVLQTQQFFRYLYADINLEIQYLKQDNCSLFIDHVNKIFKKNHDKIENLLVVYDLSQIGNPVKDYFKTKVNLTFAELQELSICLKSSSEDNIEDAWIKLRNCRASDHLYLSKSHIKTGDDTFSNLRDFIGNIEDIDSKQNIKDFVAYLEKVSKVEKVSYSMSLSIRRSIVGFLRYIPLCSPLTSAIHPSKKAVEFIKEPKDFFGNKVSKSIRKSLDIAGTGSEKYLNLLHHNERLLFKSRTRRKYSLMTKIESFEFIFSSRKRLMTAIAAIIIIAMISLYVCNIILQKRDISIKMFAKFFNINATILEVFLILFIINVLVEHLIKRLLSFLIIIVKFVDQFLFGRIIAKTLYLVFAIIKSIFKEIKHFFSNSFHNFAEYGFKNTMLLALNSIYHFFTAQKIKNNFHSLIKYIIKKFQSPSEHENPFIFTTYSFNILDIVGSVKKLYSYFTYYRSASYSREVGILITWISQLNLNHDTKENHALHIKLVNYLLLHDDHESLRNDLNILRDSSPDFRAVLSESNDPLIQVMIRDNNFNISEYIKSVRLMQVKSYNEIHPGRKDVNMYSSQEENLVAKNARINAINSCLEVFEKGHLNLIVSQHNRLFTVNKSHIIVQQGLKSYKYILQNTVLNKNDLAALDVVHASILNDALKLRIAFDEIESTHSIPTPTKDFIKAFSGNSFFIVKNKSVNTIANHILTHYGKSNLMHSMAHIVEHGVRDVISIETLLSFALYKVLEFYSLASFLDKFNIAHVAKIEEIHHKIEALNSKFITQDAAMEIAEMAESARACAEIIEDWQNSIKAMKSDPFSRLGIERGSPDAKYIKQAKEILNSGLHVLCDILPINTAEEIYNRSQPNKPSTTVDETNTTPVTYTGLQPAC